jgi:putative holliday junction resolvase
LKYISFDIGTERIGVAVSDESGIIARPLLTLPVTDSLFTEIGRIIETEDPKMAIFGIPRHESGDVSAAAHQIREFAKGVGHEYNIEVDFEDESGTSLEAEKRLKEAGKNIKEIKAMVDAEAAAVILESYLART